MANYLNEFLSGHMHVRFPGSRGFVDFSTCYCKDYFGSNYGTGLAKIFETRRCKGILDEVNTTV